MDILMRAEAMAQFKTKPEGGLSVVGAGFIVKSSNPDIDAEIRKNKGVNKMSIECYVSTVALAMQTAVIHGESIGLTKEYLLALFTDTLNDIDGKKGIPITVPAKDPNKPSEN